MQTTENNCRSYQEYSRIFKGQYNSTLRGKCKLSPKTKLPFNNQCGEMEGASHDLCMVSTGLHITLQIHIFPENRMKLYNNKLTKYPGIKTRPNKAQEVSNFWRQYSIQGKFIVSVLCYPI